MRKIARSKNDALMVSYINQLDKYLKNPEILETPPEEIKWDPDVKKPIKWKCK